MPKLSLRKYTAYARYRTGKRVRVVKHSPIGGPCTDGKIIHLGSAVGWDAVERLATVNHECAHIMFPAKYPKGTFQQLSNLIDDSRIERQWIAEYPHDRAGLEVLCIEVIANQKYDDDETFEDKWEIENFDPCLWGLLFFRTYLPWEVRSASTDVLKDYIEVEGLRDKVEDFDLKFEKLVRDGLAITRMKSVSTSTFQAWCELYYQVFPNANKNPESIIGEGMTQDNRAGSKGTPSQGDAEGEGSEGDDNQDAKDAVNQVAGKKTSKPDELSEEGWSEKEVEEDGDTEDNVENLKDRLREACEQANERAEDDSGFEEDENQVDDEGDDEGTGKDDDGEIGDWTGGQPGNVEVDGKFARSHHCVDRNFIPKFKSMARKLKMIAEDEVDTLVRRGGKLHRPSVMSAHRRGVLAKRPFQKTVDQFTDKPVACAVAVDFSGSTMGDMNGRLNHFMHNVLYGLQSANCESGAVTFNHKATIVKSLSDTVSPVATKSHQSGGGTSLQEAALGCAQVMKGCKATRKVSFIFTDGAVWEGEVPVIDKFLKSQGFERALLVSLGSEVPRKGRVDTVVCRSLNHLLEIFKTWISKQMGKAYA